jgi:hypothetical protein
VRRGWLLIASVASVGVLALLGFVSDGWAYANWTSVALTATGPSPSTLTTYATDVLVFDNQDAITHTVTFTNPDCSFAIPPGYEIGPGGQTITDGQQSLPPVCPGHSNFTFYVGTYLYTVDGKYAGKIVINPDPRSVTLRARTHKLRRGTQLRLYGSVQFGGNLGPGCCTPAPFPVTVYARYLGSHSLKQITTVEASGDGARSYWHLRVRPGVRTTYIAEISGQLPQGQIWTQQPSWSHPFTVQIRH